MIRNFFGESRMFFEGLDREFLFRGGEGFAEGVLGVGWRWRFVNVRRRIR